MKSKSEAEERSVSPREELRTELLNELSLEIWPEHMSNVPGCQDIDENEPPEEALEFGRRMFDAAYAAGQRAGAGRSIPVEDESPIEGEDVLVWRNFTKHYQVAHFLDGKFRVIGTWPMKSMADISHWRALPCPPETKEK